MKVLVVGAGAIGCFYSYHLSKSGYEISLLCRSDYEVVKINGVTLKLKNQEEIFKPKHVIRSVSEFIGTPDLILISSKVVSSIDVPKLIHSKVGSNTVILLIQNGIHIEDTLLKAFPANPLISGLAFICVSRIAPGVIYHQDYGRLSLGIYDTKYKASLEKINDAFIQGGIHSIIEANVLKARWKKMLWNVPFNPLSVITGGKTTAEILSTIEMEELVKAIMNEVAKVAKSEGVDLDNEIIEKHIYDTKKMKPYKTSMLLDFERGSEMEIEAIVGNVLKVATLNKIDIPNIKFLYAVLNTMQLKNRKN